MRKAIVISVVAHAAVILFAVLGLPRLVTRDFETPTVVPVELVQRVAEKAEAPPPEPEKVVEEPEPEPQPEPEPEPEPEAKPEPQPEPAPQRAEAPPEPEPTPLPKPEPPKVEPKPEPEKPKPQTPQVAPKPKPKAPSRVNFDRLAALLDKRAEDEPKPQPEKKDKPLDLSSILKDMAPEKPATQRSDIERRQIAAGLQDLIRSQIQACWSVPAGARAAENLQVDIRIFLHPNGALARTPEIVDAARMSRPGQEYFRVAAESARRAVQRCAPLKLPAETYDIWREIVLTFDPKDMLGG